MVCGPLTGELTVDSPILKFPVNLFDIIILIFPVISFRVNFGHYWYNVMEVPLI